MRFTLPFVKRILQITCTVASDLWIKRPKRTTRRWHILGFSLGFRISESTARSFHHNYSLSIKKIWHLKRNDVNLHTHWHFLSQMENWQFYHMMGIDKTTDILKQAAESLLSPECSTGGRLRLHCDGKGLLSDNGIEEILKRFPPYFISVHPAVLPCQYKHTLKTISK